MDEHQLLLFGWFTEIDLTHHMLLLLLPPLSSRSHVISSHLATKDNNLEEHYGEDRFTSRRIATVHDEAISSGSGRRTFTIVLNLN